MYQQTLFWLDFDLCLCLDNPNNNGFLTLVKVQEKLQAILSGPSGW